MSADDRAYRASRGVNWSTLKLMAKSPKHYRWALDNPDEGDTASRGMLRAVHTLVLEPHRFEADYAVCSMRRDPRAKAYQEFLAEHEGKTILSEKEHGDACAIAAAVRADPVAAAILNDPHARFEVPLAWTDEATGLQCKGRADLVIMHPDDPDAAVLIDLKGARRVDARGLARDAGQMLYHGQLAHYAAGVRAVYGVSEVACGILAYEAAAPHDVVLAWLDKDTDMWAGEVLRDGLMARLKTCLDADEWPGQHPSPIVLNLPPYLLPDAEDGDITEEN